MEDFRLDGLIEISHKEFRQIADLVYERFGINLTDSKVALVRGRLNKIIKSAGFTSFNDYYNAVVSDTTGRSILSMIDRISTNHSFFFREKDHFDYLRTVILPGLVKNLKERGINKIRIWCAGCAGGEEAYSLAFILDEFFGFTIGDWDIGILATDISHSSLEQAVRGEYAYDKIKRVPRHFVSRYMKKKKETDPLRQGETIYRVTGHVREMILFKQLNLMMDSFPFKGKFHIIFLRNVMIYFDQQTRHALVKKLHRYMYDDSYMFIGHAESIGRLTRDFEYIKPAVYKRI